MGVFKFFFLLGFGSLSRKLQERFVPDWEKQSEYPAAGDFQWSVTAFPSVNVSEESYTSSDYFSGNEVIHWCTVLKVHSCTADPALRYLHFTTLELLSLEVLPHVKLLIMDLSAFGKKWSGDHWSCSLQISLGEPEIEGKLSHISGFFWSEEPVRAPLCFVSQLG